jgi:acetyl-CoA synthetase
MSKIKEGIIMHKISIADTATFNRCKDECHEGYSYTIWFCTHAQDGSRHPITRFHCFQSIKRLNSVAEVVLAITNNIVNGKSAVEAIFESGTPDFSHVLINEGNITDDLPEEGQVCFCGSEN